MHLCNYLVILQHIPLPLLLLMSLFCLLPLITLNLNTKIFVFLCLQDSTLLTSHSLTERVKLWDKFTVPVDQDSIRLKFFQQVHRKNPPFRYKVRRALRSRIRVSATPPTEVYVVMPQCAQLTFTFEKLHCYGLKFKS